MDKDTSQFPSRFDYYLHSAEAWLPILQKVNMENMETVTEVGAGWAPKIPMALIRSHFRGKYTAIDMNKDYLELYSHFISCLDIPFGVQTITADFLLSDNQQTDLLIFNHSLEDLILHFFLYTCAPTQEVPYGSRTAFTALWKEIAAQPLSFLEQFTELLEDKISDTVSPKGKIVICQYPGYQEKLWGVSEPYSTSIKTLDLLRNRWKDTKVFQAKKLKFKPVTSFTNSPYFTSRDCFCFQKP